MCLQALKTVSASIFTLNVRRQERNTFYYSRLEVHWLLLLWHPAGLLRPWSNKGDRKKTASLTASCILKLRNLIMFPQNLSVSCYFRSPTVWQSWLHCWESRSARGWAKIWVLIVTSLYLTWKQGDKIFIFVIVNRNKNQTWAKGGRYKIYHSTWTWICHLCSLSTSGSNSSDSDGLPVHLLNQPQTTLLEVYKCTPSWSGV